MTTPTHPELLALVAKWREDAAKLRRMAGKSQRRDDPLQADVLFANAQDADGYADELQSTIDSLAAQRVEADHSTLMESWRGALIDAEDIFRNSTDERIRSRASRLVTWIKHHPPQAQASAVEVDEAMVERAALALWSTDDCTSTEWHNFPEYGRERYRDKARAALTAAIQGRQND